MNNRVTREQSAYDDGCVYEKSSRLQGRFNHVFKCPNTQRAEKYFTTALQRATPNRVALDYGCYDGHTSEQLLHYSPLKVVGIDISEKGIINAKSKLGNKAEFHVMDAHQLSFSDQTFDLVVGRAILHHLNFKIAIHEISRILRPGGFAIFYEPLGSNPAGKLIRYLTKNARTQDESPLTGSQIKWANQQFSENAHLFVNLISVPIGMISSLVSHNPENLLLRISDGIDMLVSKSFIRYWMRSVVLVWKK